MRIPRMACLARRSKNFPHYTRLAGNILESPMKKGGTAPPLGMSGSSDRERVVSLRSLSHLPQLPLFWRGSSCHQTRTVSPLPRCLRSGRLPRSPNISGPGNRHAALDHSTHSELDLLLRSMLFSHLGIVRCAEQALERKHSGRRDRTLWNDFQKMMYWSWPGRVAMHLFPTFPV